MYFFKGAISRERFGFFKQVKKIGQNKAAILICKRGEAAKSLSCTSRNSDFVLQIWPN